MLIERVEARADAGMGEALVRVHLRHVAREDLSARSPEQWAAVVASQADAAARRAPGETLVRVIEDGTRAGAPAGRSVLEVVTDDMPFLVDSVSMAVSACGLRSELVIHPRVGAQRDADGRLVGACGAEELVEAGEGWFAESWICVETDLVTGAAADAFVAAVREALDDVRVAVRDWRPMRERLLQSAGALDDTIARDFLTWVAADNFTFLGAADLVAGPDATMVPLVETGLGIFSEGHGGRSLEVEPVTGAEGSVLVVDKAIDRSTVHRTGNLDRLTIRTFDATGQAVGERRILGLWSSRARSESLLRIPGVARTVSQVLLLAGVSADEHAGKAVIDALESYPRDEFLASEAASLVPVALSAAAGGESRRLRAFVRRDPRGRYVSVLVNLPRDRYSTAVRERLAEHLQRLFDGAWVEFGARLDETRTARVHFVVHPPAGQALAEPDEAQVETELAETARSWVDDLLRSAVERHGAEKGAEVARRWGAGLPEGYKESTEITEAVEDLAVLDEMIEAAEATDALALRMVSTHGRSTRLPGGRRIARLKVCRLGAPISLARILPLLHSAGVEVLDERPHRIEGPHGEAWIYDFEMSHPEDVPHAQPELFVAAIRAMWQNRCEVDGFNALVLEAGLSWRQVTVLRAYGSYLRQGRFAFREETMVAALRANIAVTRLLVHLFDIRFDPDHVAGASGEELPEGRSAAEETCSAALAEALSQVERRDHDRVLSAYAAVLDATLRTNHFRTDEVGDGSVSGAEGEPRAHLALKLAPRRIPGLPEPRPEFEIFVHSPRLEGVHLRFGSVARGGLRWSDRSDDFRTEVLGLVKAQMVKNTVIVPVGAKGGFVARNLPDPSDREAWLAEGVACYRAFISSLLDVTDNLVDGEVVAPPRVLRRDGDDHYMVVAADKGTASFSDIANALSADYGFWLGDAFASGGSVGYDHKGMGITARGAWVSVQRHFRERGLDVQSDEFTCVGIGDMSGDVFGNGLLCSSATRLVAAFDHRDIFLDPTPDAAASFEERRRLFTLPRSSWRDYDTSLISAGGGVHSRSSKSIPITPQVRQALGIDEGVTRLAPEELIRAVLTAPVDLLWNGGIGTYVKASTETHADVGDAANDLIRVDGRDLRVRAIGEGGNLGMTQAGRVEMARTFRARGADAHDLPTWGAVNTDFIDNSAGVDTSDREVNIKILLDGVVAAGGLGAEERAEVLASMTDEVGDLVLRDNYRQNLALADAAARSSEQLHEHEQWMRLLEERGVLDRDLEVLPSRTETRRRRENGEGLTVPELAVLLSWTKIVLAGELLDSDLPDDGYLRGDLIGYFPSALRQERRSEMLAHPLRREIVTTEVVNSCVDEAGITAWMNATARTGASAAAFARAHLLAGELFGTAAVREAIADLDHTVPAEVQTRMRAAVREAQEEATLWFLVRAGGAAVDTEEVVDGFSVPIQRLVVDLQTLLSGAAGQASAARQRELVEAGVPEQLAATVAALPEASALLDVVRTASMTSAPIDAADVARIHFAVGDLMGLHRLLTELEHLPRAGRWDAAAAAALRDDLTQAHVALTRAVVDGRFGQENAEAQVEAWRTEGGAPVVQADETVREVLAEGPLDLARASVALRAVRSLLDEG